jgi:hypothetical protein
LCDMSFMFHRFLLSDISDSIYIFSLSRAPLLFF